jgi:Raf kinase inhibitor-like YbhB/YbcL family protein
MNRLLLNISIIAVTVAVAASGCGPKQDKGPIAFDLPETATQNKIEVGCKSFTPGTPIPIDYTGYGGSKLPEITWKSYPKGTKAMWLIIEDPDAEGKEPFVHWLLGNIKPENRVTPGGGVECLNSRNEPGYYAPHPPAGSPHRYYFELFAVDKPFAANTRDEALQQMNGHVLGKGEFMCTFHKP